jgi:hypothetical protein
MLFVILLAYRIQPGCDSPEMQTPSLQRSEVVIYCPVEPVVFVAVDGPLVVRVV